MLVNLKTNGIFTLNSTGSRLWELLEEGFDPEGAKSQMLKEFDIGSEALEVEIKQLLADLIDAELLLTNAGVDP